jgi:hypothetical protein
MSSFAYASGAEEMLLLPDLSVSADGPVQSILLFSAPDAYAKEDIALISKLPFSMPRFNSAGTLETISAERIEHQLFTRWGDSDADTGHQDNHNRKN